MRVSPPDKVTAKNYLIIHLLYSQTLYILASTASLKNDSTVFTCVFLDAINLILHTFAAYFCTNHTHKHAYLGLSRLSTTRPFCVPVQDVSPRSEGRVLVRQPSHRPTHPISPHREGRPQLQPVPQRAGAGAP